MVRFDLSQIIDPKDRTPSINVALPVGGAYLLQCALTSMDKRWQWIDDGDALSDEDWDDLQDELAALMLAIMTEDSTPMATIGIVSAWLYDPGSDYLVLDGGTHDDGDFPDLAASLSGGNFDNGDGTFTLPDIRDSYVQGKGLATDLGDIGGEVAHTLIIGELPSHDHELRNLSSAGASGSDNYPITGGSKTKYKNTTDRIGAGEAHNNLPPYVVLEYYIRALG